MTTNVLGISAFYHDAAAALAVDGRIVAAAQEERFSRRKHDPRFPAKAIDYCLEEGFLHSDELDAVVFYDSPQLTVDRVVKNALAVGPAGQFVSACHTLMGAKASLERDLQESRPTPGARSPAMPSPTSSCVTESSCSATFPCRSRRGPPKACQRSTRNRSAATPRPTSAPATTVSAVPPTPR